MTASIKPQIRIHGNFDQSSLMFGGSFASVNPRGFTFARKLGTGTHDAICEQWLQLDRGFASTETFNGQLYIWGPNYLQLGSRFTPVEMSRRAFVSGTYAPASIKPQIHTRGNAEGLCA